MPSRYEQLRQAIADLAAPAADQDARLCGWGLDARYGNDELALTFGGIFLAANDMFDQGELSESQRRASAPLDALLQRWSGQENADFWERQALWTDPRWEEVRMCALEVLASFPEP
jgi:hypothetical protein